MSARVKAAIAFASALAAQGMHDEEVRIVVSKDEFWNWVADTESLRRFAVEPSGMQGGCVTSFSLWAPCGIRIQVEQAESRAER